MGGPGGEREASSVVWGLVYFGSWSLRVDCVFKVKVFIITNLTDLE